MTLTRPLLRRPLHALAGCYLALLPALVLAAFPAPAGAQLTPQEEIAGAKEIRPDDAARLARGLDPMFAAAFPTGEPGAAVIVTLNGEVLLRKAYGRADASGASDAKPEPEPESKPEATEAPARPFLLGPALEEPFTAVAVLLLAEEGELSLEAPAAGLLPGSPPLDRRITLHHLLTHTSGLSGEPPPEPGQDQAEGDATPPERLERLARRPLVFTPGEGWQPSSVDRWLVKRILEAASGESWGRLVETRIFRPLEMTSSSASGGGLLTNVDDLARFAAALAEGRLLSPESRQRLETPATLPDGRSLRYGYGWGVWEYEGHRVLDQEQAPAGKGEGSSGSLVRLPDDGLFVAVLSRNPKARRSPGELALAAATRLVRKPVDDPMARLLLPEVLDQYVGAYQVAGEPGRSWQVSREGLRIFVQAPGGERREAFALRLDELGYPGEPTRLRFQRDVNGRVDALVISRRRGPDERAQKRRAAGPG